MTPDSVKRTRASMHLNFFHAGGLWRMRIRNVEHGKKHSDNSEKSIPLCLTLSPLDACRRRTESFLTVLDLPQLYCYYQCNTHWNKPREDFPHRQIPEAFLINLGGVVAFIDAWIGVFGNWFAQKLTQRAPSVPWSMFQ